MLKQVCKITGEYIMNKASIVHCVMWYHNVRVKLRIAKLKHKYPETYAKMQLNTTSKILIY